MEQCSVLTFVLFGEVARQLLGGLPQNILQAVTFTTLLVIASVTEMCPLLFVSFALIIKQIIHLAFHLVKSRILGAPIGSKTC